MNRTAAVNTQTRVSARSCAHARPLGRKVGTAHGSIIIVVYKGLLLKMDR